MRGTRPSADPAHSQTYQIGTSSEPPIDFVAEAMRLRKRWQTTDLFGRAADWRKIEELVRTRDYLRAARTHRGLFQIAARSMGIRYGKIENKVLRAVHAMSVRSSRTPVNRFGAILAWMTDQLESDAELLRRIKPLNLGMLVRIAKSGQIDETPWDTWWGFGAQGEVNVEYWTPRLWFEIMKLTFTLDPASPGRARVPWIPAKNHYTQQDDGLAQPWYGRVWLNAPWGDGNMVRWVDKFIEHGRGMILVPDSTATVWFQKLIAASDMLLFVSKKIRFMTPHGLAPSSFPRGSALFAVGDKECVRGLIRAHRAGLGTLMIPASAALIARYENDS